jgi:hypothetical protein
MMELSPANYRDINASTTSFASLAAYVEAAMNLVGQGEPLRVEGSIVTGNLFSTLGRSPLIGRYFSDRDDQAGAPGTVMLSYSFWQTEFGGRPACWEINHPDDAAYTVIGVIPPDFHFLAAIHSSEDISRKEKKGSETTTSSRESAATHIHRTSAHQRRVTTYATAVSKEN